MKKLLLLIALLVVACSDSGDQDLPQGFDYREYVDHESSTCKVVMHSENQHPDQSLFISDEYITVGAFGGFSPRFYYRESDGNSFSVFDVAVLELKRVRLKIDQRVGDEHKIVSMHQRIDVLFVLDSTHSDDQLLHDVAKFQPLLVYTKALFLDIRIHLQDAIVRRFGSEEKQVKFMYRLYRALGLELQKESERPNDYCISKEQIENVYSFDSLSRYRDIVGHGDGDSSI